MQKINRKIKVIFKKIFLDLPLAFRIGFFIIFTLVSYSLILSEILVHLKLNSDSLIKFRIILYSISLIIIIFSYLHLYFFLKYSFRNPIKEILKGIEQVNQGNFKVRIHIFSKDEFGKISSAFNKMLSSIRKKNRALENYSKNLNQLIEQKTLELREKIKEIETIKKMQDGDYYLTSVLIEQLQKTHIESSYCKIEIFIKQKKEFEFRNKKGEIGGDLCISKKIFLKEEPYIFFLNADAMGKSIQGAVGALIIASVMESILERTLKAFIFKNYSPERWLKNSSAELKHIFDVFNQAMGATLILGLFEEKTGCVYFINFEHPPMILLRNSKAQYLYPDFHFKRLGVNSPLKENLFIKVFKLKPDDILIIGSDGKDDIRTQGKIQNDPENILKLVEKTKGDIQLLFDEIKKSGEIIDDVSLLKLHYLPEVFKDVHKKNEIKNLLTNLKRQYNQNQIDEKEVIEFCEKHLNFPFCNIFLIKHYIKLKDYEKIEIYTKKYLEIDSSNNNILYLLFYSLHKQKKFYEAIEYGERCYIRTPNHSILLIQLADCYFKTNNFSRGEYLTEKALEIDPDNPKIKMFIQKMAFYN